MIADYLRHCSYSVVEAANTDEASLALTEPSLSIDVILCALSTVGSQSCFELATCRLVPFSSSTCHCSSSRLCCVMKCSARQRRCWGRACWRYGPKSTDPTRRVISDSHVLVRGESSVELIDVQLLKSHLVHHDMGGPNLACAQVFVMQRKKIGRDERIRTSDPHTPSVMRYQAALRPDRPGDA